MVSYDLIWLFARPRPATSRKIAVFLTAVLPIPLHLPRALNVLPLAGRGLTRKSAAFLTRLLNLLSPLPSATMVGTGMSPLPPAALMAAAETPLLPLPRLPSLLDSPATRTNRTTTSAQRNRVPHPRARLASKLALFPA